MLRWTLTGLKVPYICPLPDRSRPVPLWRHGSALVHLRRAPEPTLLTQYFRVPQGNLVLHELWFNEEKVH